MRTATAHDSTSTGVRIVRARAPRPSRLAVAGSPPGRIRPTHELDLQPTRRDVPAPFFGEGGPAVQPGTRLPANVDGT
jgi:hypothetical protein